MSSLIGQILKNRYRVIESLGRGGMAEVYKVWDEDRSVDIAMKVLRQDIAQDPVFLRRFQREAQSLSKLKHPNIVSFYGLEREKLLAFLLMEFVDGHSLQAEILLTEGKPLSNQRILDVFKPICSALHYAHKKRLVHCDIKPGNILIEEKSGRVLLTDFGIARTMDAATSTLVGVGTPAYMAPELIKGMDPTPQSDSYSLGIVLFEMLSGGERPFTGERAETTGTTAEKVRWEHLHLSAPPISRLNPKAAKGLDAVIAKCLAKDPSKRYARTLDVFEALAALLGVGQVPAIEVNQSPESTNDLNSPIIREHVPGSDGQRKSILRNLLIAAGLSLILYLGVNWFKNAQRNWNTRSISFQKTLTEAAKQEILNNIANIENEAFEISLKYGDTNFSLTETYTINSLECHSVGIREYENFIIQVVFSDSGDAVEGWDYGITFRQSGNNDRYELAFTNTGEWFLNNRIEGDNVPIISDYSEFIHSTSGSTNIVKLIADSYKGYLFINNEFVGELDLSDRMNFGEIKICVDLLDSYGNDGNKVYVDNVSLWKLP